MPKGKQPSLRDVLEEVRATREEVHGQGVVLEEMRAQNHATIEAVETFRVTVEQRFDRLERETDGRFTVLEVAVRQNSADLRGVREEVRKNGEDIRTNSADIRKNSDDIRALGARVEALGSLDGRVSAIERRVSREG
jgi:hypothetical protein